MRQCHRPERDALVRSLEQRWRKTIRPANGTKNGTATFIPPTPDQRGKSLAINRFALFVKSDEAVFAELACYGRRFFGFPVVRPRGAAFRKFEIIKTAQSQRAARLPGPLEITVSKEALRPILQAADSNQSNPHGRAGSGADALGRTVTTPHLFKIVE